MKTVVWAACAAAVGVVAGYAAGWALAALYEWTVGPLPSHPVPARPASRR